jgi:rhodanese-related sulfurtransferase
MRHLVLSLCCLAGAVACAGDTAPASPAAAAKAPAAAPAPAFADVNYEELSKLVASKSVVLLDANGSTSFAEGHIPGAIDFKATAADLAGKLPADKGALVVAYCGGPSCGAWEEAAKAAKSLGYTQIKHFSAGISGWKKSGGALEM